MLLQLSTSMAGSSAVVAFGHTLSPVPEDAAAEPSPVPVEPVEAAGWDGDALEAQLFAYLAIRSVKSLPLSLPGTTGVPRPLTGGRLNRA